MKRISTTLRESEATAVRKAVCIAGAERVVITTMPYPTCGIDMVDIGSEKNVAESGMYVRLDVIADNSRSRSVIAAIRSIAHAAKIVLSSRPHMHSRHAV